MPKKGMVWVSAVLYILITVVVMVIVLEAGTPLLNNLKDETIFMQTRDNFISLSQFIEDVSSSGPGTQRVIPIEIRKGDLEVGHSMLKWEMETGATILDPGSIVDLGNLNIAVDADVNAYESGESLIMENSYILVNLSKIGDRENPANMTTSDIIRFIKFKKTGVATDGQFSFDIGSGLDIGTGHTELLNKGYNMGAATLMASINSSGTVYNLYIRLKSNSDYITVDVG